MRKSSQLIVNPLFAISQIAVLASNNCFRNKFVVANVSLNGLTRGPKTFLIKINPSKKVTRKVKTVRYLSIIKLIARTFIYLISNFSQFFFFCLKRWTKTYHTNTPSISPCKSVQFGHLYCKLHHKNRRNSTRESFSKFKMHFNFFSYAPSNWQVSDFDRYLWKKPVSEFVTCLLDHVTLYLFLSFFLLIYFLSLLIFLSSCGLAR